MADQLINPYAATRELILGLCPLGGGMFSTRRGGHDSGESVET
jgi:hypothetical protein